MKSYQASLCCMLLKSTGTAGNMAQGMGCTESLLAGFTSGTLSWKLLGSRELSTSFIHSSRSTGSHKKSVTQSSRLRVPRTDTTAHDSQTSDHCTTQLDGRGCHARCCSNRYSARSTVEVCCAVFQTQCPPMDRHHFTTQLNIRLLSC